MKVTVIPAPVRLARSRMSHVGNPRIGSSLQRGWGQILSVVLDFKGIVALSLVSRYEVERIVQLAPGF